MEKPAAILTLEDKKIIDETISPAAYPQTLASAQPPADYIDIKTPSVTKKEFSVSVNAIKTNFFDPVVWEQMKGMAEVFKASGAFPAEDNAAKLLVKMQAGREMGMTPIESVKSFYFVKGTINIFGAAAQRRLREHGWNIKYKDEPNKCTAEIFNEKGEKYTDSLTFEEAEKSGWTKGTYGLKPGWMEGANRKLKLRYGVISLLIKTYVPEVLGSAVDIAEVAMDAAPVYEAYKNQLPAMPDGNQPATEAQIATIEAIDPLVHPINITRQEARDLLIELTNKKKGKNG